MRSPHHKYNDNVCGITFPVDERTLTTYQNPLIQRILVINRPYGETERTMSQGVEVTTRDCNYLL